MNRYKVKRLVARLGMACFLAYLGVCAGLFLLQRSILYKPHYSYDTPASLGLTELQEVTIVTRDKLELLSWYAPPTTNPRTIIYFHGNEGGLTKRQDFYRKIINAGYGLLALEYRGFSLNEGRPTEKGLYLDARAAFDWLSKKHVTPQDIIIIGRSLGTGVAVQMATEYDVALTALISPYSSIADIGKIRYWYAPVDLLLRDAFDSLSKVNSLRSPILIFHGTADTIIPVSQAQKLYDAIPTDKSLFIYDGLTHSNIDFDIVLKEIAAALSADKKL